LEGVAGLIHNEAGAGVLVVVETGTRVEVGVSVDTVDGAVGTQAPTIDARMIKRKYLFTLFSLSSRRRIFI
jgi:hypothetical protein